MLSARAGPYQWECVMNINQLRNFSLMYGETSFVAAARKAGVTSQGFTKSIRALEAELGVPLFERNGEGVQCPTAYAEDLLPFCRETLAGYYAFLGVVRLRREGARARLALAASFGTASLLGMDYLSEFSEAHPEIKVESIDASDLEAEAAVRDGRAEVAITTLPVESDLASKWLASCRLCAWVSRESALARKSSLRMDDLDGASVALVGPAYKGYRRFQEACDRLGVRPSSITALSETTLLYQFAKEGRGVALTSDRRLHDFPQDDSVVLLPVRSRPIEMGLAWLRARELSPQAVAFIGWLQPKGRRIARRVSGALGK